MLSAYSGKARNKHAPWMFHFLTNICMQALFIQPMIWSKEISSNEYFLSFPIRGKLSLVPIDCRRRRNDAKKTRMTLTLKKLLLCNLRYSLLFKI